MNHICVSILVPVFNGLEFTKKCLKSLEDQITLASDNFCQFYVVIIDDGSQDGTSNWVKKYFPWVILIKGNGTLWWSGGINMGCKYAINELKTDYILWWNNDILPHSDYLKNLKHILRAESKNVIIGSKIYKLGEGLIWGMGGKFNPKTGKKYMYGNNCKDKAKFQISFEVDWFPGMGTVMHKSVYEKIGFLNDKDFPQYHGDSDFTFRAKKNGFKLIAYPELIIYNDNSNTGLIHKGNFRFLFNSLISIKSNFNIKKDLLFLKIHSHSSRAYFPLIKKYYRYIGGFIKWRILNFIGFRKK